MFGHIDDLELFNSRNRYWSECKLSASIHNKTAVPPPRYGTFNKLTKCAMSRHLNPMSPHR